MTDTALQDNLVRTMPWQGTAHDLNLLLEREWLVTNGQGGYASGTISGAATRRYHGLLIAALPEPLGRWMMFNHLSERIRLPSGAALAIGGEERVGGVLDLYGLDHFVEFRLEDGLPVWLYRLEGYSIEKRVILLYQENTVHINYRLTTGDGVVRLKLRPAVHFREHDAPVSETLDRPFRLSAENDQFELSNGDPHAPRLRLHLNAAEPAFTFEGRTLPQILYRVEESRGYDFRGDLWTPGYFRANLTRDRDVTLIASTESWEIMNALTPAQAFATERERRQRLLRQADPAARSGFGAELVLAADQFLIRPAGRIEEAAALRRRRRSAHDLRRLLLVHRLGPRHHD